MKNNSTEPEIGEYILPLEQLHISILGIMLALCIFGNALVITAIQTTKKMRVPAFILIINLSISDILSGICGIPFTLISYNMVYGSGDSYADVGCKILWPLTVYSKCCGAFTLVAIAVERYLNTSASHIRLMKKATFIVIGVIHALSLVVVLPYIITQEYLTTMSNERNVSHCHERWEDEDYKNIYTILLFFMEYALPLSFMIVFYCLTWRRIYLRNKSVIKMSEDYERKMDWRHSLYGKTLLPESKSTPIVRQLLVKKHIDNESYLEIPENKSSLNLTRSVSCETNKRASVNLRKAPKLTRQRSDNISFRSGSYSCRTESVCSAESVRKAERFLKSPYSSQISFVRHRQSITTLQMFTVVVVVFTCFGLPHQISWFLKGYTHLPPEASHVFILLTYVSGVVNCWIYGGYHSCIRQAYCRILCRRHYSKRLSRHASSYTTESELMSPSLYPRRKEELFRERKTTFDDMFEESIKNFENLKHLYRVSKCVVEESDDTTNSCVRL